MAIHAIPKTEQLWWLRNIDSLFAAVYFPSPPSGSQTLNEEQNKMFATWTVGKRMRVLLRVPSTLYLNWIITSFKFSEIWTNAVMHQQISSRPVLEWVKKESMKDTGFQFWCLIAKSNRFQTSLHWHCANRIARMPSRCYELWKMPIH